MLHRVEQRFALATEIGADRVADIIRPLPMQRYPDRVCNVFVVRRNVTGATVPFMQYGTSRCELLVEYLEVVSPDLGSKILGGSGHLGFGQRGDGLAHARFTHALPRAIDVGIDCLLDMGNRYPRDHRNHRVRLTHAVGAVTCEAGLQSLLRHDDRGCEQQQQQ